MNIWIHIWIFEYIQFSILWLQDFLYLLHASLRQTELRGDYIGLFALFVLSDYLHRIICTILTKCQTVYSILSQSFLASAHFVVCLCFTCSLQYSLFVYVNKDAKFCQHCPSQMQLIYALLAQLTNLKSPKIWGRKKSYELIQISNIKITTI